MGGSYIVIVRRVFLNVETAEYTALAVVPCGDHRRQSLEESMSNRQLPAGYTLRSRTALRDAVALLFVPAVLFGIVWLPPSVRSSLIFEYANPSLLAAYTSSFVHATPSHLAVNLIGYGLLVPIEYVLSTLCGYKQRFYISYLTFVLVFPFALTGLALLFIRPGAGMGFSGVLMAFYGYLPLVMSDLVTERFDIDTQRNVAPLLYFVGIGIITVLGVWPSLDDLTVALGTAGLLVVILLVLLWYFFSILETHNGVRTTVREAWQATGYFELFLIAFALLVLFPFAMFPFDPASATGVVDTYTHLLAYSLGFIATFSSALVSERLADDDAEAWL